ncbi:MAG: cell division ATP-binding protein FtsE [Clostridiaceae bacterium]|nr:cell division ATP-binding protein FtsE [Clostridiaceae bacterium]
MALIEFQNVSKIYPTGTKALCNVSFSIEEGEFVFFIGESGAGKSTIFKLLTCEERPNGGRVMLDNFDVSTLEEKQIPFLRRKVGMIFQDFRLIDTMTVGENVAMAMEIIGEPPKKIRQRVPIVLSVVGLRHKVKDYPLELSGGERQRVCIARALVNRPHLIIADEPTGDLDPVNGEAIMALLDRINRNNGTTVITCSHDRGLVDRMQRRIIEVCDGALIRDDVCGLYTLESERRSFKGMRLPRSERANGLRTQTDREELEEMDRALAQLREEHQREAMSDDAEGMERVLKMRESIRGDDFYDTIRRSTSKRRNRPSARDRSEALQNQLRESAVNPEGVVRRADQISDVENSPCVSAAETICESSDNSADRSTQDVRHGCTGRVPIIRLDSQRATNHDCEGEDA